MTADELVARVKDVGSLAVRADTTSQKILDEANSEFFSRLVPIFRKMRGGFFRDYADIPIVANQVGYDLPERCIESGPEQIKYLDADGNEIIDLKEINTRQIGRLAPQWWLISDTTATVPVAFYFTQGKINLTPVVTQSVGTLRVYYSRRPGRLVLSSAAQTVVGLGDSGGDNIDTTMQLDALTGLGTISNGTTKIDIMSWQSPYLLRVKDAVITAHATPPYLTVGAGGFIAAGIVAGDYVTLAKQAFIPEIPQEWHELLLDLTVAKMFNKIGQLKSEMAMRESANEKLALLVASTSPRSTGTPKVVMPSW